MAERAGAERNSEQMPIGTAQVEIFVWDSAKSCLGPAK